MFCLIMLLLGISSQSIGYIFGTIFNEMVTQIKTKNAAFVTRALHLNFFFFQNGAALAPALIGCMMVVCIHGMGYGHELSKLTKTLLYSSYLRFGLVGTVNAIYENRDNLECNETFCLYTNPQVFLNHMGMAGSSYIIQVLGLIAYTILFRLIGFVLLKIDMSTEISIKYFNYLRKLFSRTRLNLFRAIHVR